MKPLFFTQNGRLLVDTRGEICGLNEGRFIIFNVFCKPWEDKDIIARQWNQWIEASGLVAGGKEKLLLVQNSSLVIEYLQSKKIALPKLNVLIRECLERAISTAYQTLNATIPNRATDNAARPST